MPRVIFKYPHIKGGTAKATAHLGNAVGCIAARKGVRRIDPGKMNLPATENQVNMVEKLVREFPLSKGLEECTDYQESPTRGNVSELITRAIEDHLDQAAKIMSDWSCDAVRLHMLCDLLRYRPVPVFIRMQFIWKPLLMTTGQGI